MPKTSSSPKGMIMDTQCPFCGRKFDYTLYPEIHIPGDSRLKKKVLNKTLFFPKCPHCGKECKLKPICTYRDETRKAIFVVTDSPDATFESLLKNGGIHLDIVRNEEDRLAFVKGLYTRRIVYDVDAFREKIFLLDHNYDDRIVELMKLSLSGLLEKDNHKPVYRIFLEESAGNTMEITAIMGSRAPFEYVTVNCLATNYKYFKDKYLRKLGRPEADEYIKTDQEWAKKTGLLKNVDPGYVIPF